MKYLVSASEMRRYDNNTIEKIGIPACVLMERAAMAAAEAVEAHCKEKKGQKYALIMAGMGNNGGDGLAAARLLSEKGYQVEVWCVGSPEKASEQWRQQRAILDHYEIKFAEKPSRTEYTVLLDALFGVGLSRAVSGAYEEAVGIFNRLGGWKLALDIPSGIDSDTGKVWGCAVEADQTVTFGFCKRGLVLYPGCRYAGEVITADIGISARSFFGEYPGMFAYDEDPALLLPAREPDGHKGTFGKVLLVAGSVNMAGAAVLAAKAAYRAGAGMVKVVSQKENRVILQTAVPEALLGTEESLGESMEWADAIGIGPGLGKDAAALFCLRQVIYESGKPFLVDADGLNLLAAHRELRALLAEQGERGRRIVFTPHGGELARLTGKTIADCKESLAETGRMLAEEQHAVIVAKDARTFICGEGQPICVNLSGNSGMATAGSGDVLAGIITALLARGMDGFRAASVGAYIHGRAGDRVAMERGEAACMAMEIADAVGR